MVTTNSIYYLSWFQRCWNLLGTRGSQTWNPGTCGSTETGSSSSRFHGWFQDPWNRLNWLVAFGLLAIGWAGSTPTGVVCRGSEMGDGDANGCGVVQLRETEGYVGIRSPGWLVRPCVTRIPLVSSEVGGV